MPPGMMQGIPYGMPRAPQGAPQVPQHAPPPQMQAGGYVPPRLQPPTQQRMPVVEQRPAPRLARGVRPSESQPRSQDPVAIPSPEELGVTSAGKPAALDWNLTHRQMNELGVVRFQMERLSSGGSRFTCWMSGSAAQMVQGDGLSEAEAVRACLDRLRTLRR